MGENGVLDNAMKAKQGAGTARFLEDATIAYMDIYGNQDIDEEEVPF